MYMYIEKYSSNIPIDICAHVHVYIYSYVHVYTCVDIQYMYLRILFSNIPVLCVCTMYDVGVAAVPEPVGHGAWEYLWPPGV